MQDDGKGAKVDATTAAYSLVLMHHEEEERQ
jgi:hypothetical protein